MCGVCLVFLGGVCGFFMRQVSGSVCVVIVAMCVAGGSECGRWQSMSG